MLSTTLDHPGPHGHGGAHPAPPPPPRAGRSGERYGAGDLIANKYRLLRKIGEGGMGNVWVAVHTALETQVAIKLIRREAKWAGADERLLREARAAAKLRHPAIVRTFDFGLTHQNDPYIVMELLDGATLRDAVRAPRGIAPEAALQLLLPIAAGLAAAHARGIVHRDLKPENILLARDDLGRVWPKIVDFGVAKVRSRQGPTSTHGNRAGIVGTPEYMAPEQALGMDTVDERADVWAFSVALWELVSGRYAFAGETLDEILHEVLTKEISPLAECAGTDLELSDLVARGMRKNRDDRFATMTEMGAALARWLLARGIAEDVTGASLRAAWLDGRVVSDRPPAHPAAGVGLDDEVEERTTSVALREMRAQNLDATAAKRSATIELPIASALGPASSPAPLAWASGPTSQPLALERLFVKWDGISARARRFAIGAWVVALACASATGVTLGFGEDPASASAGPAMRARGAITAAATHGANDVITAKRIEADALVAGAAATRVVPAATAESADAAAKGSKRPAKPKSSQKKHRSPVDPDLGF